MNCLIAARATFSASHKLPMHESLHGHSYEVIVWVRSDYHADAALGFRDVELLKKDLESVCGQLDHTILNESFGPTPTSERMAAWLLDKFNAEKVEINRPMENFFCEVTR